MSSLEPTKLALLRILEILKSKTDVDHRITQNEIISILDKEYGITIERKAVGRNISLLSEAGFEIEQTRTGCYLVTREFEDSELHMLIDSVLCSKHIPASFSKDLIDRICSLANEHFRSGIQYIHSVDQWDKTDNKALFYNIELIESAINEKHRISYDYNKYGADKKLRKSSYQVVSPYQMVLHNQRYYLMAYSEYWGNIVYHRLDRITNMKITDEPLTPIRSVKGYDKGIDYKAFSRELPYMYTDRPEKIVFTADASIIDQVVDWFGSDIKIAEAEDKKTAEVTVTASPTAMEYWAMQYLNFVEVKSPAALREKIKKSLADGIKKYK